MRTPVAMAEALHRGIKGSTLDGAQRARATSRRSKRPMHIAGELIALLKRAKDRAEKP